MWWCLYRVVITDSPPPRPPKTISTKPRSQSMRNKIPTHLAEQPISKSRAAVTLSSRVPSRAHTLKPSRHGHITSVCHIQSAWWKASSRKRLNYYCRWNILLFFTQKSSLLAKSPNLLPMVQNSSTFMTQTNNETKIWKQTHNEKLERCF